MNALNNEALKDVYRFWRLEADWMRCRECGRALIASRDGEPLNHRSGCKNEARGHPWQELRSAMTTTDADALLKSRET